MILHLISLVGVLIVVSVSSYSFCPKCVHYSIATKETNPTTKPNCDLFKNHTLFKDRPDVDFIGKEICTTEGKYYKLREEEGGEFIVAS